MSSFDLFTIQTKIQQNTNKIHQLKTLINKIKSNDEQIQVKSIEHANQVLMLNVLIPHTSQYILKLGNEYYAKVKTNTALTILQNRVKNAEEQNAKWLELKTNLVKATETKEQQKQNVNQNAGSHLEVIGENDDGEQIFNIMEFGESIDYRKDVKQKISQQKSTPKLPTIIQQIQDRDEQEKKENSKQQIKTNQPVIIDQPVATHQQMKQMKKNKEIIQEKQKKVSKFKAERMLAANKK